MDFNDENTPRLSTVNIAGSEKWLAKAAQDGRSIVILEEVPGGVVADVYDTKHARLLVQFPALVQAVKDLLCDNDFRARTIARTVLAALEER